MKQQGLSREEIKKAIKEFAEANGINIEALKKHCKKHREEREKRQHQTLLASEQDANNQQPEEKSEVEEE